MAVTVMQWAGAVAAGAVALFLVVFVVFATAAAISGVRDARRKARERDAARDFVTRACTDTAKAKRRG